jgi:DNA-binding MarR family transcriptional regulator
MTEVKGDFPDHIISLLGLVMDAFRHEMNAHMTGRGAPAATRGLRASHIRMLSLMPADGLRVTDLADRVGMTKQALGEFANALEEQGLIESVRDDRDRRIRILRPTEQGRRAVADGDALIGEVEADWRRRLGARRWDDLRALLRAAAELGPGQPAE